MWVLTTHLNDTHNITKWLSYEGAKADLERQLKPRREKDRESPTGFRTIWPPGWTAITRQSERGE